MGIPGQLVIATIIILSFLMIFMIGVDNTLPAFVRNDFDRINDNYFRQVVVHGKLTSEQISQFEEQLRNIGMSSISIQISPANASWGEEITLTVNAVYEYTSATSDFNRGERFYDLTYENTSTVFGLEN